MQTLLNHHLEHAKNYKFKKFKAIAPVVPEIDTAWTLCLVYFYPNSSRVMKSHWLGRFSSREEIEIFCDMNNIELDN